MNGNEFVYGLSFGPLVLWVLRPGAGAHSAPKQPESKSNSGLRAEPRSPGGAEGQHRQGQRAGRDGRDGGRGKKGPSQNIAAQAGGQACTQGGFVEVPRL